MAAPAPTITLTGTERRSSVDTHDGVVGTIVAGSPGQRTGLGAGGGVDDGELDDARNMGVGRLSTSRSNDGVAGAKSSSYLSRLPAKITDGSANASVARECTDSADEDDGGRPSAADGDDLVRRPLDRERREQLRHKVDNAAG